MIIQFCKYQNHLAFRKWLKSNLPIQQKHDGVVYKLFTQNQEKRVPVNRIAEIDSNGILYIGKTTKPFDRLALLFKSFQNPPPKNKLWQHGAEEIYWQCDKVREKYPFEKMFLEIILYEDSKTGEIVEISSYYTKFGEVPPFNGAIVKQKKQ